MNKRNIGIDIYKILAMQLVILVHLIGNGGVTLGVSNNNSMFKLVILYMLFSISYAAVNCFGIITGYLLCDKKIDFSKWIRLWLTVLFYNVGITLFFKYTHLYPVSNIDMIKALFPILTNSFWYFTSYTALLLIIPLINKALNQITLRQYYYLQLGIFITGSIACIQNSFFDFSKGYSVWWLSVLYIVGYGLKKFQEDLLKSKSFHMMRMLFSIVITTLIPFIIEGLNSVGHLSLNKEFFFNYTSPFILLIAYDLYALCHNISFKSEKISTVLSFIASSSFGVYLIQTQPILFTWFKNKLILLGNYNLFSILGVLIILIILITIFGILIDKIISYIVNFIFNTFLWKISKVKILYFNNQ